MYMMVKHIHNMYMIFPQFSMTTHVHVMYMLSIHVHALNILIFSVFTANFAYHVHVCVKF